MHHRKDVAHATSPAIYGNPDLGLLLRWLHRIHVTDCYLRVKDRRLIFGQLTHGATKRDRIPNTTSDSCNHD